MYKKQKKNLKEPASLAEHEATSSEPFGGNNTKHLPSQKKKIQTLFFCSLTAVLGMHSRFSISQLPNMKMMSHKLHNHILVQLHVLRMVSYKNFPSSLFNNYCVCDNTEWLRRTKILLVHYNTSSQKNDIWIFGFSQKKVDVCVTATVTGRTGTASFGSPSQLGFH